jgi:hypothetical protein
MFPTIPVILIVDDPEVSLEIELESVEIFLYVRENSDSTVFNNLDHDSEFRNGFWLYSLERLYAFRNLHLSAPNNKLLHIESDVLLLPNFPWDSFYELEKIYWTRYNGLKDVASLFYSPSLADTQKFIELLTKKLMIKPNLTDMSGLSELFNENKNLFGLLPSSNSNLSPLINSRNKSDSRSHAKISENFTQFDGIFDPAAIGMWLTGQDPRNYFGFTRIKFRNIIDSGDSFIDPSNVKYVLAARGELYLIAEGVKLTVWNLHIHSKNLELFGLDWKESLQEFVWKSEKPNGYMKFSATVLFNLLKVNWKQRTLIRFFLNLPYIQNFKNKVLAITRS